MGLPFRHKNGSFTTSRSQKHNNGAARTPSYLLPALCCLALLSLTAVAILKVEDFAYQTKTVVGHNLDPTPWHVFQPKVFGNEESKYARASKILQCNYLSCRRSSNSERGPGLFDPSRSSRCPEFFRWIHKDLEPWSKSRISSAHLMEAKNYAAYRIIISGGALYVDLYYDCVQSRMMFTLWGLLQLLKRYPGIVPDVDMMFDCMDRPAINRTEHRSRPLPLFRYCTTAQHFDIPFPDWSFWGWPETNVGPWDDEFRDIKRGSQSKSWIQRKPFAYWRGNPDVVSPLRQELLQCNDTKEWGAQIFRQNWFEEAKAGYMQSKLSNQCKHRYKIYAEGFAWSVSLKYIVSCGSLTLIIAPEYEDFLTRGLIPKKNYWPVSRNGLCRSIREAVDWGNSHPDIRWVSDSAFCTDFHQVQIFGVPADIRKGKTRPIEDEWTPVWDQEFEFPLTVPELALLKIQVREFDTDRRHAFGGQTCLPVWELKTGVRAVPLYDKKGEKFKSVRLLMRFQFENHHGY